MLNEKNFNELNLIEPILRALKDLKYTAPSPIQANTIPLMLEGKDILGCAQTGSGKTAAFSLPLLQQLSSKKSENIRGLIVTPTRELAIQICENMIAYGKNLNLVTGAIYGGVSPKPQIELLESGVDVLVATPGRLLDLMNQGYIKLDHVETIVLDEADQMLDMGFVGDIKKIIKHIPVNHQTVMFSATMPKPIERLAGTLLKNPITVMQDEVTHTVDTVSQYVYYVDSVNKLDLLTSLVKSNEVTSAIVFTNTKHCAEKVVKKLLKAAVRARAIHGDKGQNARQDALIQFKNHTVKVLVATDVAARGIDISKLSHVFNYEVPANPESYIHRIGRTGRAGMEGIAINFCCYDELEDFKAIESQIGQKIPELKSEWPMQVFQKKVKQPRQPRPTKREERAHVLKNGEDVTDVTKVKDVSASGKVVNKKSKFQYNKDRFGQAKSSSDKERFGQAKSSSDKERFGKSKESSEKDKKPKDRFKKEYSKKEFSSKVSSKKEYAKKDNKKFSKKNSEN